MRRRIPFLASVAVFIASVVMPVGMLIAGQQPPTWLGVMAFFGFVGAIITFA